MGLYGDDEKADPILLSFIKNLKVHGNSHALDIIDEYSGLPMFVKYEEDDGLDETPETDAQPELDKSHRSRESGQEVSSVVETQAIVKCTVDQSYNCFLDMVSSDCFLRDEEYSKFIKSLKASTSSTVCDTSPKVSTEYGLVKKLNTALDTSQRQEPSFTVMRGVQNHSNFLKRCDSGQKVQTNGGRELAVSRATGSFPYKHKLIEVLQKPFEEKEYQALLKKATERKPLTKTKILRGTSKSYATEEEGMSYLDHYPDLASELKVSNRHRRLLLLRGLFFYLQYLGHEGAFPPWRALTTC